MSIGAEAVLLQLGQCAGIVAPRQDAGVDARMQRLDATAEHPGSRSAPDGRAGEARAAQELLGAARREELDP